MRVTIGGIVPGVAPVDIVVDGDTVEALEGETIAAARDIEMDITCHEIL